MANHGHRAPTAAVLLRQARVRIGEGRGSITAQCWRGDASEHRRIDAGLWANAPGRTEAMPEPTGWKSKATDARQTEGLDGARDLPGDCADGFGEQDVPHGYLIYCRTVPDWRLFAPCLPPHPRGPARALYPGTSTQL